MLVRPGDFFAVRVAAAMVPARVGRVATARIVHDKEKGCERSTFSTRLKATTTADGRSHQERQDQQNG